MDALGDVEAGGPGDGDPCRIAADGVDGRGDVSQGTCVLHGGGCLPGVEVAAVAGPVGAGVVVGAGGRVVVVGDDAVVVVGGSRRRTRSGVWLRAPRPGSYGWATGGGRRGGAGEWKPDGFDGSEDVGVGGVGGGVCADVGVEGAVPAGDGDGLPRVVGVIGGYCACPPDDHWGGDVGVEVVVEREGDGGDEKLVAVLAGGGDVGAGGEVVGAGDPCVPVGGVDGFVGEFLHREGDAFGLRVEPCACGGGGHGGVGAGLAGRSDCADGEEAGEVGARAASVFMPLCGLTWRDLLRACWVRSGRIEGERRVGWRAGRGVRDGSFVGVGVECESAVAGGAVGGGGWSR